MSKSGSVPVSVEAPARRTGLARDEKPPGALVQPRRERFKPGLYGNGVDHTRRLVRLANRFLAPDSLIRAQALRV
jgi:hypothetical protein